MVFDTEVLAIGVTIDTVGGVVSAENVVAVAAKDAFETFPAKSNAATV
jgi:hypothetical protein